MKKQISLWIAVIMLFGTLTMFAQKPFAGSIKFEYKAEGSNDPNVAAQFADVSQEVFVMGNNTKTVIDQMGAGIIQISNGDYKTSTTIIDIPGLGKYYIELEAADIQKKFETVKIDYEYTEETQDIAGYKCKKVIEKITDLESDEESSLTLWVTSDLMTGDDINFSTYPGLKGYPLGLEMPQEINGEELTVIQKATAVTPSKKVKSSSFLRPSDAINLKDASDDVKQMLGYSDDEE